MAVIGIDSDKDTLVGCLIDADGLFVLLFDRRRGDEGHDSSSSSSARRGRYRSPNICTTTTTAYGL